MTLDLLDHSLPGSAEAERAILGSILLNDAVFVEISDALDFDDFSLEKHRRIFARMKDLHDRGERIDRVTLGNELHKTGQLESVDGLSYLLSLDDGLPEIANFESYLRIVKDKSVLRKAILACHATIEQAVGLAADSDAVLGRLRQLTDSLEACTMAAQMPTASTVVSAVGPTYIFGFGERTLIETPWKRLNQLVGGFERGQMVCIGARPSMGKTVMACQIAAHAARLGKNVAVFSLEMDNPALIQRFIASGAEVPLYKVRGGLMDYAERQRAHAALEELCGLESLGMADLAYTIPAIRAVLSKHAKRRKLDLVVIDYLQLLSIVGSNRKRVEEITEISRGVKLLAKQFDCVVVIPSQLSRESEKDNREPRLSDLRDSGSIEQDSDLVIFPNRIPNQAAEENFVRSEFIVAKQRNGRLGRIPVTFEKPYVRFKEMA